MEGGLGNFILRVATIKCFPALRPLCTGEVEGVNEDIEAEGEPMRDERESNN